MLSRTVVVIRRLIFRFRRNRFTWLELPWLYPAEINPLRTRTMANAVSTINNWLFNFVGQLSNFSLLNLVTDSHFFTQTVVMFTPPFLAKTAIGTFAFFGAVK